MTEKSVADELLGRIATRQNELFRRVKEGSLDGQKVYEGLQTLIEASKNWLIDAVLAEKRYHMAFFGRHFDLTKFRETLRKYGRQKIEFWKSLGLEPHFLPRIAMDKYAIFPGWKVRPKDAYYKAVEAGRMIRQQPDGTFQFDKKAFFLEGCTVLIDIRLKPVYDDDKQMYQNDNLLGPIIEKLRKEGKISSHPNLFPNSSRFNITDLEWEKLIKFPLANALDLSTEQIRLERFIEMNVIPQLYLDMPRRDDGKTNTRVWIEEFYGGLDERPVGGCSDLSDFLECPTGDSWRDGSIRPIIIL